MTKRTLYTYSNVRTIAEGLCISSCAIVHSSLGATVVDEVYIIFVFFFSIPSIVSHAFALILSYGVTLSRVCSQYFPCLASLSFFFILHSATSYILYIPIWCVICLSISLDPMCCTHRRHRLRRQHSKHPFKLTRRVLRVFARARGINIICGKLNIGEMWQ